MKTQVLNWWISVMDGEVEYPPGSFIAGDVTSTLVRIHLIPSVSLFTLLCRRLNFKHCFIAAFVYIFADILMAFTELKNSTFICTVNILDSRGQ
jgi:hypothetical protein